jgi:hypothetical protein
MSERPSSIGHLYRPLPFEKKTMSQSRYIFSLLHNKAAMDNGRNFFFSNSSHLEWKAGLSDTTLKGTHPRTIPARFGLIWFRGFRSSLTYIRGFSVKFFFQPIYTDYAN